MYWAKGVGGPGVAGELGRCVHDRVRHRSPDGRGDHQAARQRRHARRPRSAAPARCLHRNRHDARIRAAHRLRLLDEATAGPRARARAPQPRVPAVAPRVPQSPRTPAAGSRSARQIDVLAMDDGPDQQHGRHESVHLHVHGQLRSRHRRHRHGRTAVACARIRLPRKARASCATCAPASPGSQSDTTHMGWANYRGTNAAENFSVQIEETPNHDANHGYIGGTGGSMSAVASRHARSVLLPAARQGRPIVGALATCEHVARRSRHGVRVVGDQRGDGQRRCGRGTAWCRRARRSIRGTRRAASS